MSYDPEKIPELFGIPRKQYERMVNTAEAKNVTVSIIKDSGNRREFETGAVRDMQEGKGRCDLMPLRVVAHMMNADHLEIDRIVHWIWEFQISNETEHLYDAINDFIYQRGWDRHTMLLEVAKHFEEGAKKYGENNWQKGIPGKCYIDSAVRHYIKWRRGDTDEPHDRAFVWNLMCCIWETDYRKEIIQDMVEESE